MVILVEYDQWSSGYIPAKTAVMDAKSAMESLTSRDKTISGCNYRIQILFFGSAFDSGWLKVWSQDETITHAQQRLF